jgi:energy-coupling factor transport system ATP-binding protein
MITIQDITFTYAGAATPALADITLQVPTGQICAVIGRAGAGKSTLCALAAGFVPHFFHGTISGSAIIDGQDVIAGVVSNLVRHVALVGGNAAAQISGACDTVYDEIGFALQNLGIPRAEMHERIAWAMESLQIAHLNERSPYALSGGQQQRMVIAAALALRPPVLVLDEPTAQLDPLATEELAELLHSLATAGTTILVAEHRLEWTAALAERVIVLEQGQILAKGPTAEVLSNPQLLELKVGWPRPALIAKRAQDAGFWPQGTALPVTLAELVAGIEEPQAESGEQTGYGRAGVSAPAATSDRGLQSAPPLLLSATNIAYRYPSGVQALRGVSLEIGRGERVALLGRNGAGKSTLVRHLNGLLKPVQGSVLVAGQDTTKVGVAQCARTVGIVFQDVRNQLFAKTVREELRFGPRNLGKSASEIEALVERSLVALNLVEAADMHPYDLPPARRKLVAIAAVLAMDPDLLVLDEPTAGLDNPSIMLLAELVYSLASQGKSALVVSHDLDFCFETLDRIVLIQDGLKTLDLLALQLKPDQIELLRTTIGLPIGLQAIQALHMSPNVVISDMFIPAAPQLTT